MQVEIKPHKYKKHDMRIKADCYPFVNGKPVDAIASCGSCKHFAGDEICDGWIEEPENAPLFCGPICSRFELREEDSELIEQIVA